MHTLTHLAREARLASLQALIERVRAIAGDPVRYVVRTA